MKRLLKLAAIGLLAGAAGTLVLNLITYLDMLVRGRQASSVPSHVAGELGADAGIDSIAPANQSQQAGARRSATGALMGYVVGLGLGLLYALIQRGRRRLPLPLAGAGLGLAAMVASDAPATVTGVTDPRRWSASSWASDIVPHLAYGMTTAGVMDALSSPNGNDSMKRKRAA